MLKPNDLTKAELLQVVEMLAETANEYYLDRALGRIEMQRNDAHYARCRKLIDEEQKHYAAYFDLLRPYEGKSIVDVPQDVLEQAEGSWTRVEQAEWNQTEREEMRMANVNCLRCHFRHEDNGNCTAVGGFCTAVHEGACNGYRWRR